MARCQRQQNVAGGRAALAPQDGGVSRHLPHFATSIGAQRIVIVNNARAV
jgi:hypothetical protein